MWSEEPDMTKVLFDTSENNLKISIYPRHDQISVWYLSMTKYLFDT